MTPFSATHDHRDAATTEIIARATERAAADVRRGIVELERLVPTTTEWSHEDDASGKRLLVPKRAMLAGMLAHLKAHQT